VEQTTKKIIPKESKVSNKTTFCAHQLSINASLKVAFIISSSKA